MDANPVALLDQLDPEALARRLDVLRHEQKALRTLLRATRARQKSAQASQSADTNRPEEPRP